MTMQFKELAKLSPGDKVAIVSPSWVAGCYFPNIFQLGLQRIREVFKLEPVLMPSALKKDATEQEKADDLVEAFRRADIKAVIATIGGDHQVAYIQQLLPKEPFVENPKPFFGFSDNTHFCNFLFLLGVPSFYGGHLMTEFALTGEHMDEFTVKYFKHAMFDRNDWVALQPSQSYSEIGLDWADDENFYKRRPYFPNTMAWIWDIPGAALNSGQTVVRGVLWGGCLESIDDMLKNHVQLPSVEAFDSIVILVETSEEIPIHAQVMRVYRAMGQLCFLPRCKALLVGRAKAWERDKAEPDVAKRDEYRLKQYETVKRTFRRYNSTAPIVMNLDFGHTAPQIALPYGGQVEIDVIAQTIKCKF